MFKYSVLTALLLVGCANNTPLSECELQCEDTLVCADIETCIEPALIQTGTEMICETQLVTTSQEVCTPYTYFTDKCSASTTQHSVVVEGAAEYTYEQTECQTALHGYTSEVCVDATCITEEEICTEPAEWYQQDTTECPSEIEGNQYQWCVEFSDGWQGCGVSDKADTLVHGMLMHLSCSAVYTDGYPDIGAPVVSNGDPSVIDYSVNKWRNHSGECELKSTCGDLEQEVCEIIETEATESVCIDSDWECAKTECNTSSVIDTIATSTTYDYTCNTAECEKKEISGLACETYSDTETVAVCVEVPTWGIHTECATTEECETIEICDPDSCSPDAEWLSGGGTLLDQ